MALYSLTVDIFEAKPYPVVRHTFFGETPEECRRYLAAHLRSDAFLAECSIGGQFERRLRCRVVEHPICRCQ